MVGSSAGSTGAPFGFSPSLPLASFFCAAFRFFLLFFAPLHFFLALLECNRHECLLEFRLTPVMMLALISNGALHENAETPRTRRMAQLAQRFRFNLANTFAGNVKYLANFLERVLAAIIQ